MTLLDFLRVGEAAQDFARILYVDVVGGVDYHLAVDSRAETSEDLTELVVRNRDDDQVGILYGVDVGGRCVSAGLLGGRGGVLRIRGAEHDRVASLDT